MREKIIVGIDPGLASAGYGVVAQSGSRLRCLTYGVIQTKPENTQGERLAIIFDSIGGVLKEFTPDAAGIETLYFAKNVTNGLSVAEARGVILLAFAQWQIPVREYAPNAIKKTVTGIAQANKHQVQESVKILLGLKTAPTPDHAADALAAAITAAHTDSFL
ncbi:crossover junction endodeoxyribonuclease RuvC [Treponema phagedenis]|uniref:Crossover junction endodeoxyribonuclease RuvC n=1 Tax=Treponema phagedenis TaxID=162 RepID=A0A0B7GTQ6_TREPH|nr:crossover junction endodeoxyribonuclease RuvC [Treponema phagedenis]EFW38075.1 crossover junction endodeoxyribonuclease RuvC [Treponema phagedenis F0421]NVP25160.1 crossover junction endodeoxyribonuclease RuvC [Treponema phagedenis]QEJ96021.1 crossover junction endodeoxyribonuclease RuvC [Treponema phagedenis]QEJ97275.1 crossover junction endodeoxyribonuclease RuvC [Treponema phagedenis]QEK01786.1 crossover junction endodeoxyribonuclease RuvC [Treponema phagedenis]